MTTHLARPICLLTALSLLGCGTMAHTYTGAELNLDYRYSSSYSTRIDWPPIAIDQGGHGGGFGVKLIFERDSAVAPPAQHPIIVQPAPVPVTVRPAVKCPACSPTLKCGQGRQSGPRTMICEEAT